MTQKLLFHTRVFTNPKGTAKAVVPLACGEDLVCNDVVAKVFVLAMTVYSSMLTCSKSMAA